jgi:hypothetical protein
MAVGAGMSVGAGMLVGSGAMVGAGVAAGAQADRANTAISSTDRTTVKRFMFLSPYKLSIYCLGFFVQTLTNYIQ